LINRIGLPLVVSLAQLAAAGLALGPPDPAAAGAFLAGGWPTADDTLAGLRLLVWVIVLGGTGWSLGTLCLDLLHRAAANRRFREASALAAGLLILAAGAAHHLSYQLDMSGGSVEEAQSVLGR
jgi:hypothetical protein